MRRLLPLLLACWATVAGADTWLVSVGIERYDDADIAPGIIGTEPVFEDNGDGIMGTGIMGTEPVFDA